MVSGDAMSPESKQIHVDLKGIGFSKIGYFKEVRSKIRELEDLNIELARRHNQLEAIFNSMSDWLTILDRDLNIVFANQVQRNRFPKVIGEKCYRIYYGKSRTCKECPALRTLETEEIFHGEVLITKGVFSGRYYEWTTSPIKNPYGHLNEILLHRRDITERKNYEFKLIQADRLAAVGFLAAGIAHEINNPLASIAGFSEGLLKRLASLPEWGDPKTREYFKEYLEIINHEAYRCNDIVRNLQEFSRSSSDDYEVVGIGDIINDTVALIRQHAKDSSIQIILKDNLVAGLKDVLGNESQLKHVFLNLLNYGFKTMENGGEITLSARNEGNGIEIQISSTGCLSIPGPSEPGFEPSCPSRQIDSGVDFSLCYSIIKNHQGDFYYTAQEGRGYVFTLRFPASLP